MAYFCDFPIYYAPKSKTALLIYTEYVLPPTLSIASKTST
jgi:hypothetical protein